VRSRAGATLAEPTRAGYTFDGWIITEVPEKDTNLAVTAKADKNLSLTSMYGDVTLTAVWTPTITYKFVADFDYAPTGYQLLIVSAAPGTGNTVYYNNEQMFYISAADATINNNDGTKSGYTEVLDSTVPNAEGVYVTLVKIDADTAKTFNPTSEITFSSGTDKVLNYAVGNIDGDTDTDLHDAFVVNEMIIVGDRKYSLSALDIQHRLLADVNHDGKSDTSDVKALIDMVKGTTSSSNSNS
jgi:uncharacterized repeat protein (TIGR02543 family)